jgi:DNA-binding PadR family transcriptional regulator
MASPASQKVLRDAVLGFMRIHVLHHAAAEPIYGLEMIEELKRHGFAIGPGTMYPLLHSLEEAGLLRSNVKLVSGKNRKYYRTTKAGDVLLVRLRAQIRELVHEVVDEHDEPGATPRH